MTNQPNQEPIFADGIEFTRPSDKAPEWVKGKVSINIEKFLNFARQQRALGNISSTGYLNLDLKVSKKEGNPLYLQVDTYKSPETKSVETIKVEINKKLGKKPKSEFDGLPVVDYPEEEINPDDIPFNKS